MTRTAADILFKNARELGSKFGLTSWWREMYVLVSKDINSKKEQEGINLLRKQTLNLLPGIYKWNLLFIICKRICHI